MRNYRKNTVIWGILFAVSVLGNRIYAQDACSEKIIVGETDLESLQQIPEFWSEYRKNYADYSIDDKKIEAISNVLNSKKNRNIHITAVIGTWCGDTKEQLPVFQKIMDSLKCNNVIISYIGVDRDKLAGEKNISNLDIELVPTFIFYAIDSIDYAIDSGNLEIKSPRKFLRFLGNIIETPEGTMEEHILKILNGK